MADDSERDRARLRDLGAELRKLRVGDSRDDVLGRTRLDAWDPATPAHSTSEVEELLDPTTGGRVRSTLFQASAVVPPDFPEDWPFVAEEDAQHLRVETGTEWLESMIWHEPEDATSVVERVTAGMRELGWHEHAVEESSRQPSYEYITWFHRTDMPAGHQWRLLSLGEDNGHRGVVLSEIRPEVFGQTPTHGPGEESS